ncbi:MAG: universal stress protein [Hyphomicrobiaceae bacterium]|mgnify:CR=1 FL=1|nr:universal stress protein [Hyphomicrobiaceae bacterium]
MYKNILIATDGSELSHKAIRHGIDLAKVLGARVTAFTATTPWHSLAVGEVAVMLDPDDYAKRAAANAASYLAAVKAEADKLGIACDTVHREDEHPYQAIIDTAKQKGCDLIVMASHGRRGLSGLVLGSETVKLLTHSAIPVLVYR